MEIFGIIITFIWLGVPTLGFIGLSVYVIKAIKKIRNK